jgi:hypothetical protein
MVGPAPLSECPTIHPKSPGKQYAVREDVSRTHARRVARCSRPGTTVRAEIAASLLRPRFAIFGGMATVQPAQPGRGNPGAQLDDVHSVLALNYETLRGLISSASSRVAKPL